MPEPHANNSEPHDPPEKHRLHPIAAAVNGLRVIRQIIPLLFIAIIMRRSGELGLVAYVVMMGSFSTLLGLIRWLAFRYWVEDDELRVEQGVIFRRRIFLPRERIQAVNITSGVLQRIFGLVRVEVKTAAAGNQAELSAVSRTEAQRLQALLMPPEQLETQPTAGETETPAPLWRMTTRQLLFAASTSGQLGVILGFIGWAYSQVDQVVQERVLEWLEKTPIVESVQSTRISVIAVMVAGGLLLTWVLSVAGALLRYGAFTVERRGRDLVVTRGVLERRETVIPVRRIQAIRIVEGLLRQPFGYATIYVESAGHAEERGVSTYLHPCLHRKQWQRFLEEMAPEFAVEADLQPPPTRALRRFLFVPVALALAGAVVVSLLAPFGYVSLVAPAAVALLGWLAWRDTAMGFSQDREAIVVRSRWVERTTAIVLKRRVQFAEASSSFFQRRWNLATCRIGAASGASGRTFAARDLELERATEVLTWTSDITIQPPELSPG